MGENSVVPEALDDTNYKIWSSCMKMYLVGQDLWDIIEPEESESEESPKVWRRKNALAMHAIHMSCSKDVMSKVSELESAKDAWELLRSINNDPDPNPKSDHDSDSDANSDSDADADSDVNSDSDANPDSDAASDTNVDDDEHAAAEEQSEDDASDIKELPGIPEEQSSEDEDDVDYDPLVDAINKSDWKAVEEFIDAHPEATAQDLGDGQTVLHHVLGNGDIEIGRLLVDKTKKIEDFEIIDEDGCTPFACLATENKPGVLELLQHMVSKNPKLPNIGDIYSVPAIKASWKGYREMARYLYSVTDKDIMDPDKGIIGVKIVINSINIRLFDIASEIVTTFPKTLQKPNNEGTYPIHALAKFFSALKSRNRHKKSRLLLKLSQWLSKYSWKYLEHVRRILADEDMFEVSDDEKVAYNKARAFLKLVCAEVKNYDISMLRECVYAAMIEASKNGIVEFVKEMLIANPSLCNAFIENKNMFCYAIENRQEKVYNLIYNFMGEKDRMLSYVNPEKINVLHIVAKLAPPEVLDRTSGPALQMQRELQWFKEVWSLAKPRYREDLNTDGVNPRALFTRDHEKLIDAGEKAMKDTAQSSSVVGALIFTVMFAAAFTVPGGNNDSGLPIFLKKGLFRIFIVSDALSLYSSTTSVLVFLGILTSRFAEEDFLLRLPRKLMIGLVTLFFSIITMMVSFCAALALLLDGELRYILPTVLLAWVPIIIFLSSIVPVLSEMFMSTFGPSMFDKTAKLLEKKDDKKKLIVDSLDVVNITNTNTAEEEVEENKLNYKQTSNVDDQLQNKEDSEHLRSLANAKIAKEEKIVNNPTSVDEIV